MISPLYALSSLSHPPLIEQPYGLNHYLVEILYHKYECGKGSLTAIERYYSSHRQSLYIDNDLSP